MTGRVRDGYGAVVVFTVIAAVLVAYVVFWAIVTVYLRMIDKSGLDMGLSGSGTAFKLSSEERRAAAEQGRARQHRQAQIAVRLWPTAVFAAVAATAIIAIAAQTS